MKFNYYLLKDFVHIKYGKNQKNVAFNKDSYPIYGTGGLIRHVTKFLYDKTSVLIGRKGTIDRVKYA
ncbi:MAG: restriction endonuclease subunit S, partial [Alphaproteobacteria bacterium]|nr:restriction endonuclease subunit S [Alphaproteobacteria bacterium]